MHTSDVLREFVNMPLQSNGVNIEGLGCHDGKLYFGFRAPNLLGKCLVVETDAEKFFSAERPVCKIHQIDLGPHAGIRDLAPCRDGFLIVTGNAGSEASPKFPTPLHFDGDLKFTLFRWNPASDTVEKIGLLPATKGKAEGLLVLEETDSSISLLVLFDGPYNGGPKLYHITKPAG